jgi:uncharacterized membrane protein YbaN (DUF454 family)
MVFAALSFAVAGSWARAALTVGVVISALAMLVALLCSAHCWHRLSSRPPSHSWLHARAHTHVRQRRNHNRVRTRGLPASRSACESGACYLSDLLPFMDVYDRSTSCDL